MSCCCFGGHEDDFEGVRSHESQGGDTPPSQPPSSHVIRERFDEGDVQAVRSWREQRFSKASGRENVHRPPRAPGGSEFIDQYPTSSATRPPAPPVEFIRTSSSDSFKDKIQLSSEAAELWTMQGEDKQNRSVGEKDIANIIGSIEFDAPTKELGGGASKSTSHNQTEEKKQILYMSSDSSTDEDVLLHRSSGPVDVDEESTAMSRPDTDDGDSKPNDSRDSPSSSAYRKSPIRTPKKESLTSTPNASPIPSGRLTFNSSGGGGDNDELDAIVAAIEQGRKCVDSPPSRLRSSSQQKSSSYLIRPSTLDSPPVRKERSARSPRAVSPGDQSHGSMSSSKQQQQRSRSYVPSSPSQRRRERSLSRSRQRSQSPAAEMDIVALITPASSSSSQRRERKTSGKRVPPISTPDSTIQTKYDKALIHETDDIERLSEVPSSVDADVKDKYLTACRILKSSLIEKGSKLNHDEKEFLSNLLGEASPSEAQVTAVESAMGALQRGDQREAAAALADASWVDFDSTGMTAEMSRDKRNQRGQPEIDRKVSRAAAFSQTLSSFFNRQHEDYPFKISGTYGFKPTVLTPTIMEALLGFFPSAIAEGDCDFVLKYALQRDGADLPSLMVKIYSCKYTVFAIETTDGHVFGAFCSTPWRAQYSWFGSQESFLWRLKNPRIRNGDDHTHEYDHDNEIEVYPHTGHDDMVQYCTGKAIAVGGCAEWGEGEQGSPYRDEPAGIGLLIDGDLLGGESNACATFANPRLGNRFTSASEFEIEALEVWAVTP